jgi:hypothetical protein
MSRIKDGSVYSLFRSLKRERTPPPGEWRTLPDKSVNPEEEAGTFQESMVEGLPGAARRWLLHSIHPGTHPALKAELDLVGAFRPDPAHGWFQARLRQTVSPPLRCHAE